MGMGREDDAMRVELLKRIQRRKEVRASAEAKAKRERERALDQLREVFRSEPVTDDEIREAIRDFAVRVGTPIMLDYRDAEDRGIESLKAYVQEPDRIFDGFLQLRSEVLEIDDDEWDEGGGDDDLKSAIYFPFDRPCHCELCTYYRNHVKPMDQGLQDWTLRYRPEAFRREPDVVQLANLEGPARDA